MESLRPNNLEVYEDFDEIILIKILWSQILKAFDISSCKRAFRPPDLIQQEVHFFFVLYILFPFFKNLFSA